MSDSVTIVLPSYKPDEKLEKTVEGFFGAGFDDIVVINDGSGDEYAGIFERLSRLPGCTVLTHAENRGKGAALKTAFRWYIENRNGIGVVTADGDGQHSCGDVSRVSDALAAAGGKIILGARDFSLPEVPERSKKGNRITSRVFKILFGMKITDTQTGLRGIPAALLPGLCTVAGDRYEYETNMLIYMKRENISFDEVKIETIYINENETSHFRPVADSIRIYALILKCYFTGTFFKFAGSSGLCFLIDYSLFALLFYFISAPLGEELATAVGYAAARGVSSFVNFLINRRIFSGGSIKKTVVRYYALALCILAAGAVCVTALSAAASALPAVKSLFGDLSAKEAQTALRSVIKLPVDLVLFAASYNIQKNVVFKKECADDGK